MFSWGPQMDRNSAPQGAPAMERASPGCKDAMVATFCEAFADDPGLAWVWPDRQDRLLRLPHFFRAVVQGALEHAVAFRSASRDAVSLWRRPGEVNPTPAELQRGLPDMARAMSAGRERALLLSATLKARQPPGASWWYLQFIGVRPAAQGTGLGGAAVRAGIDLARAEGAPVYVEVTNPANVGYYRHVGFETVDEFDVPDAGPHVWAMMAHG